MTDHNLTPQMRWAMKRARKGVIPEDTLTRTREALTRRGLLLGTWLTQAGKQRAQAPDVQEQEAPHGR